MARRNAGSLAAVSDLAFARSLGGALPGSARAQGPTSSPARRSCRPLGRRRASCRSGSHCSGGAPSPAPPGGSRAPARWRQGRRRSCGACTGRTLARSQAPERLPPVKVPAQEVFEVFLAPAPRLGLAELREHELLELPEADPAASRCRARSRSRSSSTVRPRTRRTRPRR